VAEAKAHSDMGTRADRIYLIVMLAVAMLMILLGAASYQMRRAAVVDRSTDIREIYTR
jgi:hypothetical protein